jgi:hypothetical protein
MEKFIKIAADSIEALRKQDVFRVLDTYLYDGNLAEYISQNRPDLAEEVAELMLEEKEYSGAVSEPKMEADTRFYPGDIIFMEDAYDKKNRIPVNFRGYLSIVVWNGSQMPIETSRLFKNQGECRAS